MSNRRLGLLSLLVLLVAPACSLPARTAGVLAQRAQVVVGPPAVVGVDGPLGVTAIDTPAPAWQGAAPVARLTGDVAIEAARTPSVRSSWRERPRAEAEADPRLAAAESAVAAPGASRHAAARRS